MEESLRLVILAVCALAFIACVIGGLLNLFELWKPKNPNTPKFLVGGVLAAAVGAIAPNKDYLFGSDRLGQPDDARSEPVRTPDKPRRQEPDEQPPSQSPLRPSDTKPNPSPIVESPAVATPVPPCAMPHPEQLTGWAENSLGARPDFACATQRPYPTCAKSLMLRSSDETSEEEADECAVRIADFRRVSVAIIYRIKGEYGKKLQDNEMALRVDYSPIGLQRWSYISSELQRMNGQEWASFRGIDEESRADLRACNRIDKCTR